MPHSRRSVPTSRFSGGSAASISQRSSARCPGSASASTISPPPGSRRLTTRTPWSTPSCTSGHRRSTAARRRCSRNSCRHGQSPCDCEGGQMARVLYTAKATVSGGRAQGHGRTNDGALDVQLRSPKEMGGEGDGTNPEQLFAVGYAACFEGALGVVGRRERVEVGDVSIDSQVRSFTGTVRLDVTLPQVQDPEQATRSVAAAHQVCPYSNATRGNIDVILTANGREIS